MKTSATIYVSLLLVAGSFILGYGLGSRPQDGQVDAGEFWQTLKQMGEDASFLGCLKATGNADKCGEISKEVRAAIESTEKENQ